MHGPENKTCQNCKIQFAVESDDLIFYEKIGVNTPNYCSVCRAQRRLLFRNERNLYKRDCDKCKQGTITVYSPNKRFPVWCNQCWFRDDWNPLDFGQQYEPSRPFLEQFKEVWERTPKAALIQTNAVNSAYTNFCADVSNCYLVFQSSNCENCAYGYWIQKCRDSADLAFSHETELSYESDNCYNSSRLRYSRNCHACIDSLFLLDCRGCSDCIGCVNLTNKKYCIFNKQVSKEAYEAFILESRLDTWEGVEAMRKKCEDFALRQPRRFAEVFNARNVSGNYIDNAKDCARCFHCYEAEDCKYGVHVFRGAKEVVDSDACGRNAEVIFNSFGGSVNSSNLVCTMRCFSSSFTMYSAYCSNVINCLGCSGLRSKQYCILNRQYSKEEYEETRANILAELKERGLLGEFFPVSFSPFGYNESSAFDEFPLARDVATAQGYKWEEYPRGTYGKETFSWESGVPVEPLKEILACVDCNKNYRFIADELALYERLRIPLPRRCSDCRHIRRMQARGPNRIWERYCSCEGGSARDGAYLNTAVHYHGSHPCRNQIQSAYSPDRPEIVYCEQCYQAEVA